jgi:fatty-acyl-CoA synthase
LIELVETEGSRPTTIERSRHHEEAISRMRLGRIAAAHALDFIERGVRPGDRIVIARPSLIDFLGAFWGCLLAGAVAVPAPAPGSGRSRMTEIDRLLAITKRCEPRALSCSEDLARGLPHDLDVEIARPEQPEVEWPGRLIERDPSRAALIQFTSGSTTRPRGCVLTHRAIGTNLVEIVDRLDVDHAMYGVNWCPLYHDMGLVGSVLLPVWSQHLVAVQMPTTEFIVSPITWLRLLAEYRAEISAAPNFAFALLARRLRRGNVDLDLSSVRSIFCGAEPIHASTIESFLEHAAVLGLSPAAVHPAYGLAEHVVLATSHKGGMRVERLDRDLLAAGFASVTESTGEVQSAYEAVSLGPPVRGCEIRIVVEGDRQADRGVGEVQLRSPSLMEGYFNDPKATAAVMCDGWLRTGDTGYVVDGELFLVGRTKDVVISGGRNIHAHDVEYAVMGIDGLRYGGVAAFGVTSAAGLEEVILVIEARRGVAEDLVPLINQRCVLQVGVAPRTVVAVAPGSLPRTSSGKIQRQETRTRYLGGTLEVTWSP